MSEPKQHLWKVKFVERGGHSAPRYEHFVAESIDQVLVKAVRHIEASQPYSDLLVVMIELIITDIK